MPTPAPLDMYAAIDLLADKLDRLLLKQKEKLVDHHRGESLARNAIDLKTGRIGRPDLMATECHCVAAPAQRRAHRDPGRTGQPRRRARRCGAVAGRTSPRAFQRKSLPRPAAPSATSLREREQLASTAIGHGMAIPHARIAGIEEGRGAFLRLAQPVDFDAADGEPVDLVLALAVPEHHVQQHLELLAELAARFADPGYRAELRGGHYNRRAAPSAARRRFHSPTIRLRPTA